MRCDCSYNARRTPKVELAGSHWKAPPRGRARRGRPNQSLLRPDARGFDILLDLKELLYGAALALECGLSHAAAHAVAAGAVSRRCGPPHEAERPQLFVSRPWHLV